MNIRDQKALKLEAAASLSGARHEKAIISVYFAISTAVSLLVMIVNLILENMVADTGGLGNLGTRTMLQTIQTVLPYLQLVVVLCLDMGYLRCILDINRGDDPTPHTLKDGISVFWPALRLNLILWAIYIAYGVISFYLSLQIFLFTPFAGPLMDAVSAMPSTVLSGSAAIPDSVMAIAYEATLPLLAIWLPVFALFVLPVAYRYRMAKYSLLEHPRAGALAAMRKSKLIMWGNRFQLLKLDLSFWWFYLLSALSLAVCYGDVILSMLGFSLPFPPMVGYFLFYGLYVAMLFGISYCFRNYLDLTYAKAYKALCPPENTTSGGVVLGNIFEM